MKIQWKNNGIGRLLLTALFGFVVIIGFFHYGFKQYTNTWKEHLYEDIANGILQKTRALIQAKSESTMHIALALANGAQIKQALIHDDDTRLNLEVFSQTLRERTPLKNVWLQVIKADGTSFYRSWSPKRGDNLLEARQDLGPMMQTKQPTCSISAGKFDMTFKAMVPIFDAQEFLGIFEVITHFNSIAKKLEEEDGKSVILVNKPYKKQLTHPFTRTFVGDYYVANIDASEIHLHYLDGIDLDAFTSAPPLYRILEDRKELLSTFTLDGIDGRPMAFFLFFKPLDAIDTSHLKDLKLELYGWITLLYVMFLLSLFFVFQRRKTRELQYFNALLEEQNRKLETIFNTAKDGLAITDLETRFLEFNDAFLAFGGYSEAELLTHTCIELSVPEDTDKSRAMLDEVITKGFIVNFEKSCLAKNGEIRAINMSVALMPDKAHLLISAKDMTEQKQLARDLDQQINYDGLTSLPNRTLFMDRFEAYIKRAARYGKKASVILIDIDHLKEINDSLGHTAGDTVISTFARWLAECARDEDTIARLGGNMFAILHEDIDDKLSAIRVLECLKKIVDKEPLDIHSHPIHIKFSAGIALYPSDGEDAGTVYKNADAALYAAKDAGRDTYRYYTNEMTDKALERVLLESQLRDAYKNGDFLLYYQPQFDARSNTLVGAEALLRWRHASLGLIPPGQFIPVLESTNLIIDVGEWILKTAFEQAAAWRSSDRFSGIVSINLSMIQLREGRRFIESAMHLLHQTGCRAEWIGIEVTESITMDNPERAITFLQTLSDLGFQISIDDFGTGYSSLSYLKKLPLHKLKLDKSFVDNVPRDADDVTLSRTIITMASNLGLEIIAEGVETEEQKQFLIDSGCYEIQGYLFSRPLPAEEMETFLRQP